jgi:hypothetical protein
MSGMTRAMLAGAALLAALAASSAFAQQQQTVRLRGPIQAVDGSTLTVKAGEAGDVKVKLTDNAAVYGVVKAALADINRALSSLSARRRRPTAASAPFRS